MSDEAHVEGQEEGIFAEIKAEIRDLPPQVRERIWQLLIDHADTRDEPEGDLALLYARVSVRHERRGHGSRYWRLCVESGSRAEGNHKRERRYIGTVGGAEMMHVVCHLRRHYFTGLAEPFGLGVCSTHRQLFQRTKALLQWELRHVYDRDGRRNPDALALSLGYAPETDDDA